MKGLIFNVIFLDLQATSLPGLGNKLPVQQMHFPFDISGVPNKISLGLVNSFEDLTRDVGKLHYMV